MKGLQCHSNFPLESCITLLLNFVSIRSKDSHFCLYLQIIENPSKKSGGSPWRKLKPHSFWMVKMRSKIHRCQPETVPLIASFWLDVVKQINAYQVFFHCLFFKKRQWAEQFLAGTYESCYAFWPFKNCGILIFFKGYLLTFWMNFRWEGTRTSVNLLIFLRGDAIFWGKLLQCWSPFETRIPRLFFYY